MSAAPAISVSGLRKSYGNLVAIEGLDLQIAAGELVAILGPNGAGKTTTVEILEGYRRADRGQVSVLGLDPFRDGRQLRPLVGLMLQEGGIYPTLKVRESVALFASFFLDPADPSELLDRVGLKERAGTRFRQLSGGEKQRLSLALALVGRPQVLFLDEPTAGMDPRARLLTWEIVEEAQRAGTTTVLTTHSMEEAERLADRVAILNHGALVAFDSTARLRGRANSDLLHLELESDLSTALLERLRGLEGVANITALGSGSYDLRSPAPRDAAASIAELLRTEGPQIQLLRLGRSSLEEIFLKLTDDGA
ncbi:MAG TPA: ABC transporter ATP-binding protein [Candidatus Micrarchaeaceae archaeon]|nr:ABC transporter ATP-binding protein [Candidatus Micrarchaeaceae archaeon]